MFKRRDDGLGCPRGVINGVMIAIVLWALFWWALMWAVDGVRGGL